LLGSAAATVAATPLAVPREMKANLDHMLQLVDAANGFPGPQDLFTTSIYDGLDRYREMYGEYAVLPIARTDIGNVSCSITPGQPDVMRAHATYVPRTFEEESEHLQRRRNG
jgi:hypothetical protein